MDNIFSAIDTFIENAEQRFGKGSVLLIIGIIFLILPGLITPVRLTPVHHGSEFTQLSLHPFDIKSGNDLQFRILSPLIGYLLFLNGPAFKYFMLAILAVFYGLVYFFQRKNQLRPSEAIAITALLAFSTLSFHQLYFPAYTDPMSYLLILLFIFYDRNFYLSGVLLSLMLFNHENTAFLFPFFFLWLVKNDFTLKRITKIIFLFLFAIAPYIIYRKIVALNGHVEYTFSYYFDSQNMQWTREHVLPNLAIGIFQAFRLSWLLPVLAIAINFYKKKYFEIIFIMVLIAGVFLQFFIAYDISRLAGLTFPVLIISALSIREMFGAKKTLSLIFLIIILNFFIPSYYVGAMEPILLKPFWLN